MKRALVRWSRNSWVLGEDFSIEELNIVIPKGFKTDLASMPRIFWWIVPPFGDYNEAAIVHDYLYKNNIYSQQVCDKIFLDIMKMYGVNILTRWVLYTGVRLFGFITYKQYAHRTRKKYRSKYPC